VSDEKTVAKVGIGCAAVIAAIPALVIWFVLLGLLLDKTNAGVMEWSLYVGYIVCHVITFCMSAIIKFMGASE
jgi:hypothetical protein